MFVVTHPRTFTYGKGYSHGAVARAHIYTMAAVLGRQNERAWCTDILTRHDSNRRSVLGSGSSCLGPHNYGCNVLRRAPST
jgi:hypothetical protein